jgi:CheY-like chemotaxis protein
MTLRCLIVDDNASFLEAATDLLRRQGVAVVGIASSGDEAVERVRELPSHFERQPASRAASIAGHRQRCFCSS